MDYYRKKMKNDVLYTQGDWRKFIKAPIKPGNLEIINIEIREEIYRSFKDCSQSITLDSHIHSLVDEKYWLRKLLPGQRKNLFIQEKDNFFDKIKSSYYPKTLTIDIDC